MSPSSIPPEFQDYPCEDYFAKYAATGFRHPTEQYQFVEKVADIEELYDDEEDKPLDFLRIGGPGVDGISWGYRKGMPGLWMWHPSEGEFDRLADSIDALLTGWDAGEIQV